MKITINEESKTYKMPVWFGVIKNNMVWKNGAVDFKQTSARTKFKSYLKAEEALTKELNIWARVAGF